MPTLLRHPASHQAIPARQRREERFGALRLVDESGVAGHEQAAVGGAAHHRIG